MPGTPEEDLLEWLEREEERLGFTSIDDALDDITKARDLLYEELGYDITEEQFTGLQHALKTRYEDFPAIGVEMKRFEQPWGYQTIYRDILSKQFISGESVRAALEILRG